MEKWKGFSNQLELPWSEENQVRLINHVMPNQNAVRAIVKRHPGSKISYYNIPASFDIETSSWKTCSNQLEEIYVPHSCMYVWQFGLDCSVIYGRTWEEFMEFLMFLSETLDLSETLRLIIYVHNYGYEFQYLRKWIAWQKVFTTKRRRPVYSLAGGLEFRCSYFLSNASLEAIGGNKEEKMDPLLHRYIIEKAVGQLDYSLLRGSNTPLTSNELEYCFNDVKVLNCYIREKIEDDGNIAQIPLTNTGYVRNYCREWCFHGDPSDKSIPDYLRKKTHSEYRELMNSLRIQSADEYYQMKRVFQGGFTHAGAFWSNREIYSEDVGSLTEAMDIASSYPYWMVSGYFPMTPFRLIGTIDNMKEAFQHYLNNYCCMFNITFYNLRPKVIFENILSFSKCVIPKGKQYALNNGRIISAEEVNTSITEIDYEWLCKFYTWDDFYVDELRISNRGYLPKNLILSILELYQRKTSLKGIAERKLEYDISKSMINSAYGMMCTDPLREQYEYDEDWFISSPDYRKDPDAYDEFVSNQLEIYNRSGNRFLFYAWGLWVTAHARSRVFEAIYECAEDYVYCDTDSCKYLFPEHHAHFFNHSNDEAKLNLYKMCDHYKIPYSMVCPAAPNGDKKFLGVWERERPYKRFKTCGAKRYLVQYADNDKLELTVGGLSKKEGLRYLLETFKTPSRIFAEFGEGMAIPRGRAGRLSMTYIDSEDEGDFTDYLGNLNHYHELTSVYSEPGHYYMSIVNDYKKFLQGVQYVEF